MPETKSLLTDIDRASLIGTAADRLVGALPDLVAKERQALLSQLMQELDDGRETVSSLSGELRSTLQAGTETANSVHATLETLDRIAARYPPNPRDASTAEKSRPFDVTEYTQMIRALTVTTRELNILAQQMDTALPAVRSVTEDAADRFERLLNHVFSQLLVLVLAVIAATLVAALVYRAAMIRMQRGTDKGRRSIGTRMIPGW